MNKVIPALLLVLVIVLGFIVFAPKNAPSKDEALRFVNDDLEAKYPGSLHDIISAQKEGANWNIKARVTFDYGTACPTRLHDYYTYPEFGYVVREETITRGRKLGTCEVCADLPAEKCFIFFEEEAVIASHTRPGAGQVSAYVLAHPDAVPVARFYDESAGYPPEEPTNYNVWLVDWKSASDNSALNVLLNKEQGTILEVWNAN